MWDTQRDCARLLQIHDVQAVDEEGVTDEDSSEEGDVCGVECECGPDVADDEDDDILVMGWESQRETQRNRQV